MSVAKVTELICESIKSFEDAVAQGIARASKTIRNITEAWIQSEKVIVTNGKISGYRVILRVTFVLDD
jgi:flavin-binding protein dodecin